MLQDRPMKVYMMITTVLLAMIVGLLWQRERREGIEQAEKARLAAAYLDCREHAKYPDVCIAP